MCCRGHRRRAYPEGRLEYFVEVSSTKRTDEHIKAVSFDAYGTLIRLDRPFERLEKELNRIGLSVPLEIATKIFRREMAYYREHHLEGNTSENLLALRHRCADLLFRMLAQDEYDAKVSREEQLNVLMGSIRFELYEDALPVLDWCAGHGLITGVISAWDCSLINTLENLCPHCFAQMIVSAIEGMEKSDGGLFFKAAELLQIPASQIIHIGDEVESDLVGAKKSGITAVLLDREKAHKNIGSHRIESLEDFPSLFEHLFSDIQSQKPEKS
jgi:HAD superfamily hydrolase (TIGR01549 family)